MTIQPRLALAKRVQEFLRKKVTLAPIPMPPRYIAGGDAAFKKDKIVAVISLFSYPELEPLEDCIHVDLLRFPYIPGYLSFREGPCFIKAYKALKRKPDIMIFDGQGIAHPRGLGIASHMGVLLKVPTVGCAKSKLVGSYVEPGPLRGDWSYLLNGDETVGAVVRTKDHVKPLFVSPGNLTDILSSIHIILGCTKGYRMPEPIRRADQISKKISKGL